MTTVPDQQTTAKSKTPELEQELSQVATNPKRSILILAVILGIFIYLFYNLFIKPSGSQEVETNDPLPTSITKPVQPVESNDTPVPVLPSPPKLEDPMPPPPLEVDAVPTPILSTPTAVSKTPAIEQVKPPIVLPASETHSMDQHKRQDAKRKSSIILIAGVAPTKTPEQVQQETDFIKRGNMHLVLGRGKVLDAVIETAVNSDFGGEVRAIISRDVYSEWGKNILIPKGSRVFGSYTTSIDGPYGRVAIEWNRIDLISGYTLNLSGTNVDGLGRKGEQGRVDNKFREKLTNVILHSALNVVLAQGLDRMIKPQTSTQAAANQSVQVQNIQNTANATFTQAGLTNQQKIAQVCANVLAVITDKTSTAFTQINTACTNPSGNTDADKLTLLMSTITAAANTLLTNTTTNVQETKAQSASKQAYKDISETVKGFIEDQDMKRTITIDQGTHIKIYVNKDYTFPATVLGRLRSQ